ncbi:MAG: hypothetical protein QNJ12_18245 [Ilumatobacter sp.]|uniref:hypothetical protein n=1 Tax=Ilumatobacter sp. TaxID=1967498 RepID=UPI00260DA4E8|nr:hypothetical protein [Ilumatobacter sp.]MDJ0770740.1 hypothetical protein [Ilumatobacter sp.]
MGELRRVRLRGRVNEGSALLPVSSPPLLARLGAASAWWLAHDEAGLGGMVSIVRPGGERGDEGFELLPVELRGGPASVTDAEALAAADGRVFVFGSAFFGPKGTLDRRRSFVARFGEDDVASDPGSAGFGAPADVLDLGTTLVRLVDGAVETGDHALLEAHGRVRKRMVRSRKAGADVEADMAPVNLEGAAFIGDDLVVGLRWPVDELGRPLLLVIDGARELMTSAAWSADELARRPARLQPVDVDASPKRPSGCRGLTARAGALHAITGPTERDLAGRKLRAAPYRHVRFALDAGGTEVVRTLEGRRRVEGLAAYGDAGWIYVLDDEDATVLLVDDG